MTREREGRGFHCSNSRISWSLAISLIHDKAVSYDDESSLLDPPLSSRPIPPHNSLDRSATANILIRQIFPPVLRLTFTLNPGTLSKKVGAENLWGWGYSLYTRRSSQGRKSEHYGSVVDVRLSSSMFSSFYRLCIARMPPVGAWFHPLCHVMPLSFLLHLPRPSRLCSNLVSRLHLEDFGVNDKPRYFFPMLLFDKMKTFHCLHKPVYASWYMYYLIAIYLCLAFPLFGLFPPFGPLFPFFGRFRDLSGCMTACISFARTCKQEKYFQRFLNQYLEI